MNQIRDDVLATLADERFPPWFLIDDLVAALGKIGHTPEIIISELGRLTEENVVHLSYGLLGDTLVKEPLNSTRW